jgi:hypothetical protein
MIVPCGLLDLDSDDLHVCGGSPFCDEVKLEELWLWDEKLHELLEEAMMECKFCCLLAKESSDRTWVLSSCRNVEYSRRAIDSCRFN